MVKYVSAYLRVHLKIDQQRIYMMMFMRFFFLLIFFIKAYVVGTHLNCINKSMQFKWVPTTYALNKEIDKKYTSCNLKTTELLNCGLIGVCAVIRLNTVCFCGEIRKKYVVGTHYKHLTEVK